MHSPQDCALALMQMLPSGSRQKIIPADLSSARACKSQQKHSRIRRKQEVSVSHGSRPPTGQDGAGTSSDVSGGAANSAKTRRTIGAGNRRPLVLPCWAQLTVRSADKAAMRSSRRSICNRNRRRREFRVQAQTLQVGQASAEKHLCREPAESIRRSQDTSNHLQRSVGGAEQPEETRPAWSERRGRSLGACYRSAGSGPPVSNTLPSAEGQR